MDRYLDIFGKLYDEPLGTGAALGDHVLVVVGCQYMSGALHDAAELLPTLLLLLQYASSVSIGTTCMELD